MKFHIETFGCQMNKSDSEAMVLSLTRSGFTRGRDVHDSDIVIFNTCSVRDHAENRALSRFRAVRGEIRSKGGIAVVAGCMAQRIGEGLLRTGDADMVVGPYQSPRIGELLLEFIAGKKKSLFLSLEPGDLAERIDPGLATIKGDFPWHKWVSITHGCENFCTYCIVPHVRGRLVSFPSEKIVDYVRTLAESGVTEITLLGQNVNQYGADSGDIPFAELLERVALVPGINRLGFLTSHPKDFTDDIIRVIARNANVSRAIHLPLQSGSDRILGLMNRRYTMEHYSGIADTIKSTLPDHSLSTDIIVGFPGEAEEDYLKTIEAVKRIGFDSAFTYAYSPRSGTPAFDMKDDVPRKEKIDRLQELIRIQREIGTKKLMARIASTEVAIIERISRKSASSVMGRTFLDHPVILPGDESDIGKKLTVRIEGVSGSSLLGHRVNNS